MSWQETSYKLRDMMVRHDLHADGLYGGCIGYDTHDGTRILIPNLKRWETVGILIGTIDEFVGTVSLYKTSRGSWVASYETSYDEITHQGEIPGQALAELFMELQG